MIGIFGVLYLKTLSMAKIILMERRCCLYIDHGGMIPTGKLKYSEINLFQWRRFPPQIAPELPELRHSPLAVFERLGSDLVHDVQEDETVGRL